MFELLVNLPALIKTAIAFFSILILYRLGVALGVSILISSATLTLLSGSPLKGLLFQIEGFKKTENWLLIIVLLLILCFTESLKESGRMERTIVALKQWLADHNLLLMGLPALVGLLPMPGGALFSAPFVNSIDAEQKLDPAHKTAINYWFRHIWEFWWPLYPGVIFAIHYSKLSNATFMALLIPLTIISVTSGYFFMLRRLKTERQTSESKLINRKAISAALLPIGLLIAVALGGSILLQMFDIKKIHANLEALLIGLLLSLGIIVVTTPRSVVRSIRTLATLKTFLLLLVVIAIQSFSLSITAPIDDSGATLVSLMRDEMIHMRIPVLLVVILVPFIAGLVTGVAFAFVGASFPLIFALLGADPAFNIVASTTVLAYISGYTGMILSPIHVCFVVTAEYFKINLFRAYPFFWRPALTVFLSGLALSWLYYYIF